MYKNLFGSQDSLFLARFRMLKDQAKPAWRLMGLSKYLYIRRVISPVISRY